MNRLIDAVLQRSRAVILLLAVILFFGASTYMSIPREENPDIQIPTIFVSMAHEGISPEDAERLLIRPMEKELRDIEGIKEMRATASQGSASVILEFNAGFDSEKALQDVREKVDIAKSELPDDTDEPIVNEINLSLFPVVSIILTSEMPERSFISIAKQLRDKIEGLTEVLSVEIAGDRIESLDIIIDPLLLESYGLTSQIIQLVERNNILIAAGSLDSNTGRYNIKVPGLIENLSDLLSLPIKVSGDSIVRLGDIAQVRRSYKDQQSYARVNGQSALVLEVSKRTGENIIDTINKVKNIVNTEANNWPEGISIKYTQDQSARIIRMVNDLQNTITLAVLLVVIVIILFIGFRSALFIALSIPGAFLIGIILLSSVNVTLNIVVLFGLILSTGMLVDNAIVVIEYANRLMTDGHSHKTAYVEAAKRMAWPIIASTITTLLVFAPLLYWPDIIGEFMKFLPMTLIATLTGSLLMALIFVPALGKWLGRTDPATPLEKQNIHTIEGADLRTLLKTKGLTGKYVTMLSHALAHPKKSIMVILLTMMGIIATYITASPGTEFFPHVEPQNASVVIRARGNLSTLEKDKIVKQVEATILGMNSDIKIFYARSGKVTGNNKGGFPADTIGVISLEYHDWQLRRKSVDILNTIKKRTKHLAGIIVETREQKGGPVGQRAINIQVGSRDLSLIEPAIKQIRSAMENIGGFVDISDSLPIPAIEWQMNIDRAQAAKFGVDINVIGNFIKLVTNGLKASTYRPDDSDDEVDISVRLPEKYRNIGQLDNLRVITEQGAMPLTNFVERTAQPTINTINKVDTVQVISIAADVESGINANDKITEIKAWLSTAAIDPNIDIAFKGDEESQQRTQSFLGNALFFALGAMTLVLLIQFNSFYQTFIIISAVFLSIGGVFLGLLVTFKPFGIVMCGVGVIALAGIVVNNNILFIDTYNHLRIQGMEQLEALLRTGAKRMRPILLTAGTTVLGLIPMVTTMNINFITREITFGAPSTQWWEQLSTAIAGGLTFTTILTLFLTPCLLILRKK